MAILGDITMYRGDSYPFELTAINKATSEAINVEGYSITLTVNSSKEPTDTSTQLFTVNAVMDPDQETNTGVFTITPSTVNTDQTPGTYYYDVQVTDGDGNVRTTKLAKFKIIQDISKA